MSDGVSREVGDRVLEKAGHACQHCFAAGGHIHHRKYRSRGHGDPELHSEKNLDVLCADCHARTHRGDKDMAKYRTKRWQKVGETEADL